MKFAIDARMANRSGIGNCVRNWLSRVGYDVALGDPGETERFGVRCIPFRCGIYGIREQLLFPYRALRRERPDVLHVPHLNVPLLWRGRMLVTIHDLTHLVYPQFLPNFAARLYFRLMFRFVARRADRIATVSENTRRDLLRRYRLDPAKVETVPLGVGPEFRRVPRAEAEAAGRRYGVPEGRKTLMYVGNLLPHKNLATLLKAFALLPGRGNLSLLIVGAAFRGRTADLGIEELGLSGSVVLAGAVPQEDLVALYNLADLFVLPSLYEGFGLPVLEALACGTPVAASNVSSLPEVGGPVCDYFDPTSPEEMAKVIAGALDRKGTNDAEIAEWVSRFSWDRCAARYREILEEMARK